MTITAEQEIRDAAASHEQQVHLLQLNLHRLYLALAAQQMLAHFPQVATFTITRDEHDGEDITISEALDADGEPLGDDVDDAIRRDIFGNYEADDFESILGRAYTVAEAASYRPDRTPEVSLEDLGDQGEGKVSFVFTIRETTNYTGHFTADRKALAQWMQEKGYSDLSGEDLQEFASDHKIDHTEKRGDVQGQEWSDFTVKD